MNCESCKASIAELKNTNMELENVRNSPINDFIYLKFNLTSHTVLLLKLHKKFRFCILQIQIQKTPKTTEFALGYLFLNWPLLGCKCFFFHHSLQVISWCSRGGTDWACPAWRGGRGEEAASQRRRERQRVEELRCLTEKSRRGGDARFTATRQFPPDVKHTEPLFPSRDTHTHMRARAHGADKCGPQWHSQRAACRRQRCNSVSSSPGPGRQEAAPEHVSWWVRRFPVGYVSPSCRIRSSSQPRCVCACTHKLRHCITGTSTCRIRNRRRKVTTAHWYLCHWRICACHSQLRPSFALGTKSWRCTVLAKVSVDVRGFQISWSAPGDTQANAPWSRFQADERMRWFAWICIMQPWIFPQI